MMYLVMFCDEYEGCFKDEYSRVFYDEHQAEEYAKKLNIEFAEANMCEVEDLGDYYVVVEILKG